MADDKPRKPAPGGRDADLRTDPLLTRIPEVEGQKVLEPCVLYAKVGEGGMGAVYRGRHLNLEVDVAIKCLKAGLAEQSPDFITRFQREAKIAASVHHQNLVQVYDISEKNGVHYLVMEYVRGETSRERVSRKGPLSEREAARILLGAASGLAEAHDQKIVHRDIKPDNILISHDGRVKVSDLGLAKALEVDAGPSLTIGVMGTPQYMSPEQWDESNDIGPETDVWAMGATLYFLLTGDHAIPAGTMQQVYRRVCVDPFPDISDKLPQISPQLRDILQRCVSPDRAERFPNCSELAVALSRVASSTVLDPDDTGATVGAIRLPPLLSPPPAEKLGRIKVQMHDGESSVVDLARRGILSKPGLVASGALGVVALLLLGRAFFGGAPARAGDDDLVADGSEEATISAPANTPVFVPPPDDGIPSIAEAPEETPAEALRETVEDPEPAPPFDPLPVGVSSGSPGSTPAAPSSVSPSAATATPAELRVPLELDAGEVDDALEQGTDDTDEQPPVEQDEDEAVEPPLPPPPPIPALDGVSSAVWSADEPLGLEGRLEAAGGAVELPDAVALTVEWSRDGETMPYEVTVEPGEDGAFRVEVPPASRPADGRWAVALRVEDVTSASEQIVVDTLAPEIELEGEPVLVSRTEAWGLAFRAIDASAVVVELDLNGVAQEALTPDAGGRYVVDTTLPVGSNDLSLRATDRAGNAVERGLTVVVDLDPPRLVDLYPGPRVKQRAGEDFEVRLELDEPCVLRFDDDVELVPPYPIDASCGFSFHVRAPSEGRTTLSFVAIDAAGHETTVEREWEILTPIALPDGFTADAEDPDGGFPASVRDDRTGVRFLRVDGGEESATYLAATECTEAQWLEMLKVAAAQPGEPDAVARVQEIHERTSGWVLRKGASSRGLDPATHPQNWIAWGHARDVSGLLGYELPTLELWRRACLRGRPDGSRFGCEPDAIEDHAVFRASGPAPVGSKAPNAAGFHDMHGNLWEWCAEPWIQIGGAYGSTSPGILSINSPESRGSESWSNERAGFRPALTLAR